MSKFFRTQRLLLRGRPDAAYYADQEQQQLAAVQELMPRCVCFSLLAGVAPVTLAAGASH